MASKLDGHKPITSCSNCHKYLTKVLTCSRCKNATYCSKECQVTHWKEHKPRCQLCQQFKATAKVQDHKRAFRLFQQFRDAARSEGLVMALVKGFPDKKSFLQQPSPSVVILEVQFDYNYKSFIPKGPAEFVPDKRMLPAQLQVSPPPVAPEAGCVVHLLQLMHEGTATAMPMCIDTPTWKWNKESWDSIFNMLRIVKLNSSVFNTPQFHPLENFKKQLKVKQQHPSTGQFLASALAMNSTKPLHKEKLVVIDVDLGFGLGEIKHLAAWSLETPVAILRKLSSMSSRTFGVVSQCRVELVRFLSALGPCRSGQFLLSHFVSSRQDGPIFRHAQLFCLYARPNTDQQE